MVLTHVLDPIVGEDKFSIDISLQYADCPLICACVVESEYRRCGSLHKST